MNRPGLAAVLAAILACPLGCSGEGSSPAPDGLDFSALMAPDNTAGALPPRQPYRARDGARLHYRHYEADSPVRLILIHGSATDSVYLQRFANAVAGADAAQVVTPDLRGHGPSPGRRGDIAYIDQLEDDLADLVGHLRSQGAGRVIVGGHSSGGGLALRFAAGAHGDLASGCLLLAPYLGHDAPTARPSGNGWARPNLWRIVPIAMANALGIRWFNGVDVLHFDLPARYRTGRETLAYSYRLMTGFGPADYRSAFAALDAPALLLAGAEDEAFRSERYVPAITPHNAAVDVELLDGVSHLGLVMRDATAKRAVRWLDTLRQPVD